MFVITITVFVLVVIIITTITMVNIIKVVTIAVPVLLLTSRHATTSCSIRLSSSLATHYLLGLT
jgi:hypothetical protein